MLRYYVGDAVGPAHRIVLAGAILLLASVGCGKKSLVVTATAYNSVRSQADDTPKVTACGDTLKPGMKVIAVSSDLMEKGLTCGTFVTIEGLPSRYVVLDKMHRRKKRSIDIYFGESVEAALQWGKREVSIQW